MTRWLCLVLAGSVVSGRAQAADVDVAVHGVLSDAGLVRVALCEKADFPGFACRYVGSAPAHPGAVLVHIAGVVPGTYAAEVFHDTDRSGRIETNFLGLPRKAMGFSRGAWMRFGPPSFDDAALQFGTADTRVEVALRYPD